jgi:hypothetical protein
MADRGSGFAVRRPGWLVVGALAVAIGLSLAAGAPRREEQTAEVWTVLVQTGDELAAGQLTATLGGQPLTAGKAYLLAFHQAQDAGDLEHVLAVADRLDAASEPDLATHVRRAADTLVEEVGR